MKRIVSVVVLGWVALPATALGQAATDWASCPAALPACSGEADNCCYRPFDPVGTDRAILIPMDRCHQQLASSGKEGPPSAGTASPAWCGNPVGSADEGIIQAYGLIYRLMQNGIPVYWIINPTKDPPALTDNQNASSQVYTERDIDAWVLNATTASPPTAGTNLSTTACTGACADPVKKLHATTLVATADSYNYAALPLRGGSFVIAAEDRTRFNNFWKKQGEFASLSGNSTYDFSAVDLYEVTTGSKFVYQDFRTAGPAYARFNGGNSAPVSIRVDYAPPRLARLAPGGPSSVWLTSAKLNSQATAACKTGTFSPADAVYCDITETDIRNNALITGGFEWAWIDSWTDNSPCGDAGEIGQVDRVRDFMTAVPGVRAGGSVMFMEAVIEVMERCPSRQPLGVVGTSEGLDSINQAPTEPFILRRPQSLFMQWGDIPTTFASGSTGKWQYFGGTAAGYAPAHYSATGTLARLVTEDRTAAGNTACSNHKSTAGCDRFAQNASSDSIDAAAYARFEDNSENGVAFYLGGNNVNGRTSHLRLILNALLAMPSGVVPQQDPPEVREVSRSAPILATVGGIEAHYQGSFEVRIPSPTATVFNSATDAATFAFPHSHGHLRAVPAADVDSEETAFNELASPFDAAVDGIPTPSTTGCSEHFTGSCRTVFTTTAAVSSVGVKQNPGRVFFDTSNLAALKPYLGSTYTDAEVTTLISRVLAGVRDSSGDYQPALGGVDRSTMAIIEPSPLIPADTGEERPTMIYVGATDGMLHAICAEEKGACSELGQELWAFIPRTQLQLLHTNSQRIDGSPKVADVLADFTPADGESTSEWRTVLTFQTGSGAASDSSSAPAVIALDITDPTDPTVLWERTTPATRGSSELGVGLTLAMGQAQVSGDLRNLTFVQTNNGGTGGPGFYLAALDTATGELVWNYSHTYPAPRTSGNAAVPATGIPGGVAAFDLSSAGRITHLAVPSLYGDLWIFEADGDLPYGTSPVFRFSADYRPIGAAPTLYADLSTGRLHIAVASGGYADPNSASWSTATTTQYVVAVAADPQGGNLPMNETGTFADRAFATSLGAGARASAQAVVAGNEMFVVTDSTDANLLAYGAAASTGALRRYSLSTGGAKGNAIAVAGGGSSVDVASSGRVHVGSGGGAQTIAVSSTGGGGSFEAEGRSIEESEAPTGTRVLWISG